jgi:GAF domain-containing protein
VGDLVVVSPRGGSGATAARLGISAAAGIPLHLNGERLGALNLYDAQPRSWDDDELSTAGVLAAIATSYIINASELARAQRTAEQLQHALDSRIVIESPRLSPTIS